MAETEQNSELPMSHVATSAHNRTPAVQPPPCACSRCQATRPIVRVHSLDSSAWTCWPRKTEFAPSRGPHEAARVTMSDTLSRETGKGGKKRRTKPEKAATDSASQPSQPKRRRTSAPLARRPESHPWSTRPSSAMPGEARPWPRTSLPVPLQVHLSGSWLWLQPPIVLILQSQP